jgi:toxin-antitoxin system PIN domain toxin
VTYLLDVNVLIALIDSGHLHYDVAHRWFEDEGYRNWATCPITEHGVMRILGSPRYARSPGTPVIVGAIMRRLSTLTGHHFWADDISISDLSIFNPDHLRKSEQITDTYLLGLAKAHDGMLATFDRKLSTAAVIDGKSALHIIGQ